MTSSSSLIKPPPCVLTIAGTDPSSAAGIQVDLQVCRDFRIHGLSVITAVVSQNTQGVLDVFPIPAEYVTRQLQAVFSDFRIQAIKIGMVPNVEVAQAIASTLSSFPHIPVVYDPILTSGDGRTSLSSSFDQIWRILAPVSMLITPNVKEASAILGYDVSTRPLEETAEQIQQRTQCAYVLLKAGHVKTYQERELISDVFASREDVYALGAFHAIEEDVRGTGCQLSTAIACNIVRHGAGDETSLTIDFARVYLNDLLHKKRCSPGKGRPIIVRTSPNT